VIFPYFRLLSTSSCVEKIYFSIWLLSLDVKPVHRWVTSQWLVRGYVKQASIFSDGSVCRLRSTFRPQAVSKSAPLSSFSYVLCSYSQFPHQPGCVDSLGHLWFPLCMKGSQLARVGCRLHGPFVDLTFPGSSHYFSGNVAVPLFALMGWLT
jgi:hypothetical protein